MTIDSEFYKQLQSLKSGNEITLEQSKKSYFFKAVVSILMVSWGFLSVIYWIERPLINGRLAELVGTTNFPGLYTQFKITFGLGLAGIFFIPWTIQNLFYSTTIIMNASFLIYKSRGRVQKISWDQVIEIKSFDLPVGEGEGGIEMVEVRGEYSRIIIESQYDVSTNKLLEFLRDCWSVCTDREGVSSYTGLRNIGVIDSREGKIYDKPVLIGQPKRNEDERENAAIVNRVLLVAISVVVLACLAAIVAMRMYLD